MTDKIIKAKDAQAFLDSPNVYREAIEKMGEYLDAACLSCDPTDKDKAANIISAKQLLNGIIREISRFVEDGQVEEFRLHEIDKGKKQEFRR